MAGLSYIRAGRAVGTSEVANGLSEQANDLSRQALEWQRELDADRHRTSVRIELTQSAEPLPFFLMVVGGEPVDPRPEPVHHCINLDVINGGQTEALTAPFIEESGEGSGRAGLDLTDNLPGRKDYELQPRQRCTKKVSASDLGFEPAGGFVAWGRLASGEEVRSEVGHPDEHLLNLVEKHNRGARPR